MIVARISLFSRSAHSSEATTIAPAPSLTPGELPAVCEPSLPCRPGSLASFSREESRRGDSSTSTTVSPFRPLIVTETISSGIRPSSVAAIVRSCERSAQRSMSARVISSSSPTSVASWNICLPVKALVRPSWTIASSALASPMRKPKRAFGSRYGACDIDSMPPPTPTSMSPARIDWSSSPTARMPDAQTLLIVSEETSIGIPALICAWREGIWPTPACRTCPITTCCTCSGATSARSSAAPMAIPPRSVGCSEARPPPILPTGVRALPRMTVRGMQVSGFGWRRDPIKGFACQARRAPSSPLAFGDVTPRDELLRRRSPSATLLWPPMRAEATTSAPAETGADTIAIGLFEGEPIAHDVDGGLLQALVDSGEAKAKPRKLAVTHAGGLRYVLAGLGKREEFDAERARVAAATVVGRARELGARFLCWELPHHVGDAEAGGFVEGTLMAAYTYRAYKSKPEEDGGLERLAVSAHHDVSAPVARAAVAAEAANAARDLQNAPANEMTPERLAERAHELAAELGSLTVETMGREAIEAAGMGAFAGVARGSDQEPQLITLRYAPVGADGPVLGLVGKAVTFDSGGISLKPGMKMSEMKFDMSGGAAVLEATGAIARLGLPIPVVAVIGATENMPSGHALKPGDIVRARTGK